MAICNVVKLHLRDYIACKVGQDVSNPWVTKKLEELEYKITQIGAGVGHEVLIPDKYSASFSGRDLKSGSILWTYIVPDKATLFAIRGACVSTYASGILRFAQTYLDGEVKNYDIVMVGTGEWATFSEQVDIPFEADAKIDMFYIGEGMLPGITVPSISSLSVSAMFLTPPVSYHNE